MIGSTGLNTTEGLDYNILRSIDPKEFWSLI